ncbi:excisionase family DNA binding protein [Nocardioides daedukensis]|uniref:Excisionase family DNA binding protein n=1 Tax=Nocardioides daedukensis TaxID=634462 RepID=A0A7Y9UVX1_9ACTN|nr:helix-turn-helix domain-containing protein [Nocardioides daedukensis]NYG59415.1 excisionase family DNA binding protein [Nocardioides daedukensis]
MARISVAEAAAQLGVGPQRVHQRIQDGSLPAERIGSRWVIDEKHLHRIAGSRAPGRPLSERSGWALIAVAAGDSDLLQDLSAPDRSRARARLRSLLSAAYDIDDPREVGRLLSTALRNRANRRCYRAAAPDLPDLREDHRILLSGLSHPDSGLTAGDVVEGYMSIDDLDDVMQEYLLRDVDEDRANVFLHIVPPDAQPRRLGNRARKLLLAADLAQHDGPRELHRAVDVLRELSEPSYERPSSDKGGSR